MLGQRVLALDLEGRLRVAGDAVEEERLLDRRDERVADPAEQRVVRPDRELVLPALGQRARVVRELPLRVVAIESEARAHGRVDAPAARLDVLRRDERVRLRMVPVGVDEPDRVEDLHRPVRIEAGDDLRDRAEVAVDELAEPPVVVDRARSRPAADEELEARDAERVLDVDGEEADRGSSSVRSGPNPVLLDPDAERLGRARSYGTRHTSPTRSGRWKSGTGSSRIATESSPALQVRRFDCR